MTYIAPNSTVEFFADLCISDNYENSLYFPNTSAKDSYFTQLPKYTSSATALSYTRSERGTFRVEKRMNQLLGCQYIRFKNTNYENKWFYAFVNDVRMVNNITTEISFTLDVLMTWMGEFHLAQCFVEREHSSTDAIGDNLIEESLELGEYVASSLKESFQIVTPRSADVVDEDGNIIAYGTALNYDICVTTAVEEDEEKSTDPSPVFKPVDGGYYGRVYSGLKNEYFDGGNTKGLEKYLDKITRANKSNSIVSIKMTPNNFRSGLNEEPPIYIKSIPKMTNEDTIDGYRPINKKLLTSPYNYLELSDGATKFVNLSYEFFAVQCSFKFIGLTGAISEVSCIPLTYKNIGENREYQITINDFPDCAYLIDAYQAWLAQHKNESFYMNGIGALPTFLSILGGTTGGVLGGQRSGLPNLPTDVDTLTTTQGNMTAYDLMGGGRAGINAGAIVGGIAGGLGAFYRVQEAMAKNRDRMTVSPSIGGNQTTNIDYAYTYKDFYHTRKSITRKYAERIDKYFNMYGYAQKTVKIPLDWENENTSLNGRPAYAYTKTIGCTVHGNIPSSHASTIEKIFDNGIRFWRIHNDIGNYNVDNAV